LSIPAAGTAPAASRLLEPPPAPAPVQFPLTVTDTNGNELTFDEPPERIVAYDSAVVEILFAIGEGHRVIGTHDFVSYPPEADDVPRLGGAFDINIEAIVALEPDLVFLFFDRFQPDLERAGVKVFYLQTLNNDFTRVADQIRLWGQITDSPVEAEEVALEFERRVDRIAGMVGLGGDRASIFQDIGGFWTPGADTLISEVFELLKLRNVADDISGYAQLSPEVIVEKDPHVILTTDRNAILDNPAFAKVAAVRNGQVFDLNSTLLSVAGPRFVDGIEELAQLVYPALFR
jgi:iron complex transport system substrate-binding protein